MTGEFRFEDIWMGPWFRLVNPHASVSEEYVPPKAFPVMGVAESAQQRVVECSQPFSVHFGWSAEGLINSFNLNLLPNPFAWECEIMVEGMGTAFEGVVVNWIEPFAPGVPGPNFPHAYASNRTVNPPAGGWPAGIFDIVATLKLVQVDATNNVIRRYPVVGFAELGKLQTYVSP